MSDKIDSLIRADLEAFDARTADLGEVFEDWVKILQVAKDRLKTELVGGSASRTIGKELVVKIREVSGALDRAVAAEERLRKTAKDRAAAMTPQQRADALERAILQLPYPERRARILALLEKHNALRRAALVARTETPGPVGKAAEDQPPVRVL